MEWCVWIGWIVGKGLNTKLYRDGVVYMYYMNNNRM